jgi:signal transduction histidine kinase
MGSEANPPPGKSKSHGGSFQISIDVLPKTSVLVQLIPMDAQVDVPTGGPAGTAPAPEKSLVAFMPRSWLEGGIATLDADGHVLEVNEPLSSWLEKTPGSLVGQSFWETLSALSPDWNKSLSPLRGGMAPFDRVNLKLSGNHPHPAQWFTLEVARAASIRFVRLSSTLPPLAELEEGIWDEHLRNDDARRELFVRLLRAEARLEGLTRRFPCVIFSQRPDFSLHFASPNIKELTGIDPADWPGKPGRFWDLVHESDAAELQQQFKRAVLAGSAVTNTYRIRHAVTGRVAYILEHRQPAISQSGLLLGYEVVWLDVTRQTIAEKRLSTAAWKETLAVLTLGMAHDFTNIIAGIHSLSESFLSDLGPVHPFHEGLSLIKKSSLQASQLVQRMINLHLGQTGERNYHNLNDIANDLVELVTKILPRRIQVKTELATAQLPVYLDVVEFRQVVINLMLNAADAMPQGGRLILRTSRHEFLPALDNKKGVTPRLPCICLTIQDTGSGIKQRYLASIFDPFFTTKAKGSGLGLYNARIAIEKHQGLISVDSKEGAGTSFQLWLPEADFSESARVEEEERRARLDRRSLMLVGQPGEMLEKTAELLRSHNYYIVVASSSDSLGDLLQSSDYHFAGVLLLAEPNDPALNSLPNEVRQENKDLKVVLKLAGCNQDDLDSQLLKGIDLLLNPDLSEADMLLKLKSFLDQHG